MHPSLQQNDGSLRLTCGRRTHDLASTIQYRSQGNNVGRANNQQYPLYYPTLLPGGGHPPQLGHLINDADLPLPSPLMTLQARLHPVLQQQQDLPLRSLLPSQVHVMVWRRCSDRAGVLLRARAGPS